MPSITVALNEREAALVRFALSSMSCFYTDGLEDAPVAMAALESDEMRAVKARMATELRDRFVTQPEELSSSIIDRFLGGR